MLWNQCSLVIFMVLKISQSFQQQKSDKIYLHHQVQISILKWACLKQVHSSVMFNHSSFSLQKQSISTSWVSWTHLGPCFTFLSFKTYPDCHNLTFAKRFSNWINTTTFQGERNFVTLWATVDINLYWNKPPISTLTRTSLLQHS